MFENFLEWLPKLLDGLGVTVMLTFVTMPIALILGLVFALCRLDGSKKMLAWPVAALVEIIRGTPLILQLFYIYFVLPYVGIRLDPLVAGVVALSLNYAAYLSEVYRSGIAAIDRSQWEAGQALSMRHGAILQRIVLPQAIRIVIPPVGNYFVSLFKDTALVSTIGVADLLFQGRLLASASFEYFAIFTVIFVFYFIISFPAMRGVRALDLQLEKGIRR
ncbi:amino acid ABC transporter permease [Arthrobacter sp. MW3 TE3886]|uniref:amino acid ABC transporter permease n=1 Tax=Arthrobacter sp. MW3 TE3886 TaxID=3156254 RepID=UPI00351620C2